MSILKTILNWCSLFIATIAFIGKIPFMPGTFGTLAGVLIWLLAVPQNFKIQLVVVTGIVIISVIFAGIAEKILDNIDDKSIVIDEVAGIFITFLFIPKEFLFIVLGFILFRFFDIKKPFIINFVQKFKSGFGITADDLLAGIFSNIILHIVKAVLYD
jgi:phosphatidylglycerophosphatase A